MNYWWVNQGQTADQEIEGSYLWSPKFARGDRPLTAYENMKDIEPGDLVFSYHDKKIRHYGFATGRALSSPKPEEFGKAGLNWSDSGWCVSVTWVAVNPIDREVIGREAARIFDEFENPFTINQTIKQSYLFRISKKAADFIMELEKISTFDYLDQSHALESSFFVAEQAIDDLVEKSVVQRTDLENTEKATIVQARRGQGLYRDNLYRFEKACRITGVDDQRILVASHIKPWRACETTHEKLDGNNGLLLTPTMDKLFDRRYMTFEDDGGVILSKKISPDTYERIGLHADKRISVGKFSKEQCRYLEYHRGIFLG